jgi:hypothetical protein
MNPETTMDRFFAAANTEATSIDINYLEKKTNQLPSAGATLFNLM